MGRKTTAPEAAPESMWGRVADAYRRLIVGWSWVIPVVTGFVGLVSAVFSTKVFLALWAGLAVFAALTVVTLLMSGVRVPAGWCAAIVLIPFIGEVGVMSYFMLMLAACAFITLLAVYAVLAAISYLTGRRARRPVAA